MSEDLIEREKTEAEAAEMPAPSDNAKSDPKKISLRKYIALSIVFGLLFVLSVIIAFYASDNFHRKHIVVTEYTDRQLFLVFFQSAYKR